MGAAVPHQIGHQIETILEVRAHHPPMHRALEAFGIASAYSLSLLLVVRCVWYVFDRGTLGAASVLIGAALAGYIVADLASGMVHWTFDRFFSTKTPILGPNFVTPFREHHTDPADITRHDFIETSGNNCLVTLPLLGALMLVPMDRGVALFVVATLTFAAVATFATNQFHKWAHTENPPRVVVMLQRANLILSPEHHNIHHTKPNDSHYCITVGWLNEALSKVGAWSRMEYFAEKVLGFKVYRG